MLLDSDFTKVVYTNEVKHATFEWSSPSNIALVKYWGKKEHQIPANASISFTLSNCKTITKVIFTAKEYAGDFSFDFYFDGQPKEDFKPKITTFFQRIERYLPFLKTYHMEIHSQNTFPHSSGIASSASGMAALSMNLMSLEKAMCPAMTDAYFYQKASFLARLGSGSACRSVQGATVIWGTHEETHGSSNLYGVPFEDIHSNFNQVQDTILLVDKGEKQVSSTVGHDLMIGHPFAEKRFAQAQEHITSMKQILKSGDWDAFIALLESEALTLHAMMMTSMPYFILMKPATLEVINKIWLFRAKNQIKVGFTLDAGANVHVLYPIQDKEVVLQFIHDELAVYCQNNHYICDQVGMGSIQLT